MLTEPRATYRVQLHAGFTLDDAAALVDYLQALGISHLYCSPYLQAARGSTHGYDVVNPHRVNVELGGEAARKRMVSALQAHGMGQLLDIVPNHMAIGGDDNPWWWDVLKYGPASRYASYFDVEWNPPEARHKDEVLVPVLGDQYGRVLENKEIQLDASGPEFLVRYHQNSYPVDPRSLGPILAAAAGQCGSAELASLAASYAEQIPQPAVINRKIAQSRQRQVAALEVRLQALREVQPEVDAAVQNTVRAWNDSVDMLDTFLQAQNYRLAYWRISSGELGYRRFFDINTLIGLRMEDEEVFADTHRLILGWLESGAVEGLRIDHPDGLLDPEGYFCRIQAAQPGAWVVIEKILEEDEQLPESWPVAGTTGYEFLNRVNGLFVDPRGEGALLDLYRRFTGRAGAYASLAYEKKLQVINTLLGSDLNRLVELFLQVCERHRNYRDTSRRDLRLVISETAACLPVYRTYARAGQAQVHESDVIFLEKAIAAAREHRSEVDPRLFDFFRDLLLLRITGALESELVMRFQQFTGPVMAKGVEDTTFYQYYPLVSLNEVGGNPGQFGTTLEDFHAACARAVKMHPRGLLASTTHDTKRSEDVRARINVLSEMPEQWAAAVERWWQINTRTRRKHPIDANDEYLLYQTLVGAWPIGEERLLQYMEKACREAKTHTSWTNPNAGYENAVAGFVRAVLRSRTFRAELKRFLARIEPVGWVNALAQTLVKLTAPGVADIYQGSELWAYTLVDPDNRAPVDYALRRALLEQLDECSPEQIWARAPEGLPKLWVIRQALALRKQHPQWFTAEGGYRPLLPSGGENVVAYRRGGAICIVPRLSLHARTMANVSLKIPAGKWKNEMTGEIIQGGEVMAAALLERFPVALLSKMGA
jgi:(1->4)-alpha-D-glucan 1-alpha-D-glucosylmutase